MKRLKKHLVITIISIAIFATGACDSFKKNNDLNTSCQCIEQCEEQRAVIDAEFQQCISLLVAEFSANLGNCPQGDRDVFQNCFLRELNNFNDKMSECKLKWREEKSEIDACKEKCK